jgi:flavin reductase (DIM6/NTAB) family NADH-FMN oxidoreductase RutF
MSIEISEPEHSKVLMLFTYGIYVVSAHAGEENNAFVANWLSQCCFDPPMIMVSIQKDARTRQMIRASGLFAVHVLATGQREFAGMLGKSSRSNMNKLKNVRWHPSAVTGCPILEDTLGYVECRVTGELPAGDSDIVLGKVIHGEMLSDETIDPLTMKETGFKHYG